MKTEAEEPVMSRLGTAFTRLVYVDEIPASVNLNIKDYEEIKEYLFHISNADNKPYENKLSSGIEIDTINILGKELSIEVEIPNNQKSILISKKGAIQKF